MTTKNEMPWERYQRELAEAKARRGTDTIAITYARYLAETEDAYNRYVKATSRYPLPTKQAESQQP